MNADELKPGQRVRIVQQIDRRAEPWRTAVSGTVVTVDFEKTGSWYAHGKDGRLWLARVRLRKDDGEQVVLALDSLSEVELISNATSVV